MACFYTRGGGVTAVNVERGCGVSVAVGCDPVLHRRYTCLCRPTQTRRKLHMLHLYVRWSLFWHWSCHHTPHPAQGALYSLLTRVSSGIKEALRAKLKWSTCFLKEKSPKSRGRLFLRGFKVLANKWPKNDKTDNSRIVILLETALPPQTREDHS